LIWPGTFGRPAPPSPRWPHEPPPPPARRRMKTPTEYQQDFRAARYKEGLREVRSIWASPELHQSIKTYAAKQQAKLNRKAKEQK